MAESIPQLHHCTKYESLCKILQSGCFRPSFCLEQVSFINGFKEAAYAVVCFADLIPAELEKHLNSFNADSYIVMSKEWAMRNHVCPVLYYNPNSVPASAMENWTRLLVSKGKDWDKLVYNVTNLMFPYMKQYKGRYFNRNTGSFSTEERIFYLEREWRYIPLVFDEEAFYLSGEDYRNTKIRGEKTKELEDKYSLKFNESDIIEIGIPKGRYDDFMSKILNADKLTIKII